MVVSASAIVLLSGSNIFSRVFATSAIRGIRFLQVSISNLGLNFITFVKLKLKIFLKWAMN